MKIITILFILFTLVISTEIRDETTLGSVGNEENINSEMTEDKLVKVLFDKEFFVGETLYLASIVFKFVFLIVSVSLIYVKYNKYITNQTGKSSENGEWICSAIKDIIQNGIKTLLTFWMFRSLFVMFSLPAILLFY